MVHLRVVVPADKTDRVHGLLCATASAINVIRVPDASTNPSGDLIMCDVAREDASVIISELRELGLHHEGSIALSPTDVVSDFAVAAERHAPGSPADAVIWEELDQRTSESVELSAVFLIYMVLAAIIAAIGIFLDSPILVVGAMVVGPEFGPVAGLCVALVQRRGLLARRSATALVLGFPLAILATVVATLLFDAADIVPDTFSSAEHGLSKSISSPDAFAVIVALCAGAAGMLESVDRQIRRADRRADLGHDHSRRREHRHRGGLQGLGHLRGVDRTARREPRCDPARRHCHALPAASAVPAQEAAQPPR